MREDPLKMSTQKSPVKQSSMEDNTEKKTSKAFSSPSTLAAKMRLTQSMQIQRSDQRDDGVSVASSRRDPDRFKDSKTSPALEAISDSTSVKASTKPKPGDGSAAKSRTNTLRNLADVAGLGLHDAPPQVPVDTVHKPTSMTDAAVANTEALNRAGASVNAPSAAGSSDIDPDLVSAISKLVASKQAAAAGTPTNDASSVTTLTRQIGQLAEQRRSSRVPPSPAPDSVRRSGPPRPTPENAPLSPRSQARATKAVADSPASSQGRSQLDLMVNDNSFSVIADIVLQPFKKGAALSKEDCAQIDAAVPPQVRQSFVEAVRYRLEHNCPPGSSEHIHVVTRKCQVLGFDKEGSANPLLAIGMAKTVNVAPETIKQVAKDPPAASTTDATKESELTASEVLARQQLVAELREASNFMADSKTKEASNFWRNHVLELQARLHALNGGSVEDNNGTDDDIMEATRRLLEEAPSSEADASEQPTANSIDVGDSQSYSQITSLKSSTGTSASSEEWAQGGILAKGGVMNQLAYLRDLYDLIDLLIMLLEVDKLLDFLDAQKVPEKLKDAFKHVDPDVVHDYFKKNGYDQYFDSEYLQKEFENFEDQIDIDKFVDELERKMDPKQFKKFLNDSTKTFLGPDQLREAMDLDKIRSMTDPVALRYYFHQQGLDKVWDMDKLKEIMDAKKLREAIDADNIREVLKSRTVRDFMGDTYRGPKPMVDVVAPSNLPGGYRFEAQIDGHRFLATVPKGGVKKGETFSCLMNDIDSMYAGDIPVGGWRDRLSDPLIHGVCHPVFWTTLFCPLLTLAQVMTRLKYDFLGRPRTKDASTFPVMSSIIVMYFTLNIAIVVAYNIKWSQGFELSVADISALAFVNVAMLAFSIYATSATRASIRDKYMIREHRCYDVEDCCCATFCMPCTICQMSRHTTDYTRHEAKCCTETGLEEGAELPNTGSNVSRTNYFCGENEGGEQYWCADERDLV